MKFKLTKITGKSNKTPAEFTGESLIIHGKDGYLIIENDLESLHDLINVGDRVQIISDEKYLLTSAIEAVILDTGKEVTFRTKNSIYKLTLIED